MIHCSYLMLGRWTKLSLCCMSKLVRVLKLHYTFTHTQQAEAAGEDYERVKLLETSAIDVDKKDRKRKKKNNPDTGFAGMTSHSNHTEKLILYHLFVI